MQRLEITGYVVQSSKKRKSKSWPQELMDVVPGCSTPLFPLRNIKRMEFQFYYAHLSTTVTQYP